MLPHPRLVGWPEMRPNLYRKFAVAKFWACVIRATQRCRLSVFRVVQTQYERVELVSDAPWSGRRVIPVDTVTTWWRQGGGNAWVGLMGAMNSGAKRSDRVVVFQGKTLSTWALAVNRGLVVHGLLYTSAINLGLHGWWINIDGSGQLGRCRHKSRRKRRPRRKWLRLYRTRAHQGMRYPNVTWRISSCMITYLPLYRTPVLPVRNIFLSKAHMLRIMDVGLQKATCVSLRVIIHFLYF